MICRQKNDKAYQMCAVDFSLTQGFKWHCPLQAGYCAPVSVCNEQPVSHRNCFEEKSVLLIQNKMKF